MIHVGLLGMFRVDIVVLGARDFESPMQSSGTLCRQPFQWRATFCQSLLVCVDYGRLRTSNYFAPVNLLAFINKAIVDHIRPRCALPSPLPGRSCL